MLSCVRQHNLSTNSDDDDDPMDVRGGMVRQGVPWPHLLGILQEMVNIHSADATHRRQILLAAAAIVARNDDDDANAERVGTSSAVDEAQRMLRQWSLWYHPDNISSAVGGIGAPQSICKLATQEANVHAQRIAWARDALCNL